MPRALLGNIPSAIAHGTSADSNAWASVLSSRYVSFTKKGKGKNPAGFGSEPLK